MRRRDLACLGVALLLAGACGGKGGGSARLGGSVRSADGPVAGASVEFYLGPLSDGRAEPFVTALADGDGRFSAELPAGRYWLMARVERPDGVRLTGEYPANPAVAGKASPDVVIDVAPAASARVYRGPDDSGLEGSALQDGAAVPGAWVYVYDTPAGGLRGPGYVTAEPAGDDGTFRVRLHPGKYWVAVRRKKEGEKTGFVGDGDVTAAYPGNPVTVSAGRFTRLETFRLHAAGQAEMDRVGEERSSSPRATGLSGRVVRDDGSPVSGLYVLAYTHPQMIGRPAALTVSGPDGRFSLALPRGGRYYLGARQNRSGPRRPGEVAGVYEETADHAIEVAEKAARTNLVIRVRESW